MPRRRRAHTDLDRLCIEHPVEFEAAAIDSKTSTRLVNAEDPRTLNHLVVTVLNRY